MKYARKYLLVALALAVWGTSPASAGTRHDCVVIFPLVLGVGY